MNNYLHLRYLMLKRMAKELGIVLSLLLTFAMMAIVYAFTFLSWYWQALAFAFLLLCVSQKRGDISFLSTTLGRKNVWRVMMLDNVLLSLPFITINLLRGNIVIALLLMGVALLATFFRRSTSLCLKPTRTLLRMGGFEYEKGFRESIVIYILAIVLVVISIYVVNQNMGKIVAATYLMMYVAVFPNIKVRRDYMMCYRSARQLCIMTVANTFAYVAILGIPFFALFTLKWHLQGAYISCLFYLSSCLGCLEMGLLRYFVKGNIILTIVFLTCLFFLGLITLMKPLMLLLYVVAIICTYLLVSNKIKEEIYGCY